MVLSCFSDHPSKIDIKLSKFERFGVFLDTITHYVNECYGSGLQCEISRLTNLKFLTLGSMIRGSVIGRCIPDSVECMEINSCAFLDLDDISYVYLFKLPKALKRLKVVDSKVCFKNLRSLKCLEEVMLEFPDGESGVVSDCEGHMSPESEKQPQNWSILRIVSTIVSQLPKSVISLKIDYPNELYFNSYLDSRFLDQLVGLQIDGASITHYKLFEKLPLNLLKLIIHYHPVELTEDEDEGGQSDSESHKLEFTLELEFHQFKSAKDFRSSRIRIENTDPDKAGYEVKHDANVILNLPLVRCLSNYMINPNFKCQLGLVFT
ncbi:unnamed protein product [Ambrosiozyma monospora]|uniref:Unnamed protein product n=1 Tax=Ambrosiozyma monospora TaxID=43982 RepID=A0ACB5TNQ8_AMBMO|nr:unnamed protein product [Ambrosiozyma monospora]